MKNVLNNPVARKIILVIILIVSAFFLGKNSSPDKIQIRYKEKIKKVIEYREKEVSHAKRNVEIITRVIYKTDGTKIEEKREIDKSEIKSQKSSKNTANIQKNSQKYTKTEYNSNRVTLSAFSVIALRIPPKDVTPEFGVILQKPFISFLNAGIGVSNKGKFTFLVGISF